MSPRDIARQIPSDALRQTDVVAHLDAEMSRGKNLVWCATFQMAWNQLADEIVKAPIELKGNPLVVQALNKRQFDKRDISEDCYLAAAGFGRDGIVGEIEQRLKEKFHRESQFDFTLVLPDDIVAYAYLEKAVPFDTRFEVFDKPLLFSDGTEVQSFGIEEDNAAADQVVVLDYRHPDDLILKLQGSPRVDEGLEYGRVVERPRITDEIILAKVTPQPTLLKTIDAVLYRIGEEGRQQAIDALRKAGKSRDLLSPRLDPDGSEILQIPKITFNILHQFAEIVGKHLLNRDFEKYFVREALQATKFKLDETGAQLASEAFMAASFGIPEEPRRFIFDKPFLLCLRERQAHYPYLAVWIGNSELLVDCDT